jgi:hypothetical protein
MAERNGDMKHDPIRLRAWCEQRGFTLIPSRDGEKEYRFHPTIRWRFDFAIPEIWAAIEIEGGIWLSQVGKKSRHCTGAGMLKDMEKYNNAAALGWALFRFTPQQFRAGAWIEYLELYLKERQ